MALIRLNNQSLSSVTALPSGVGGKVLQVVNSSTDFNQVSTSQSSVDLNSASGVVWETSITFDRRHHFLWQLCFKATGSLSERPLQGGRRTTGQSRC